MRAREGAKREGEEREQSEKEREREMERERQCSSHNTVPLARDAAPNYSRPNRAHLAA